MTDFEKELIHYIFHVQDADDDNLSAEVICRKLYKYGLIDRGRRYWRPKKRPKYRWPARIIRKDEQTEPQTKRYAECYDGCNWAIGSPQCEGCEILPKTEWYEKCVKDEPQTDCSWKKGE